MVQTRAQSAEAAHQAVPLLQSTTFSFPSHTLPPLNPDALPPLPVTTLPAEHPPDIVDSIQDDFSPYSPTASEYIVEEYCATPFSTSSFASTENTETCSPPDPPIMSIWPTMTANQEVEFDPKHGGTNRSIVLEEPLISTCDKASIKEICQDIHNLNSSISDTVHRFIQENSLLSYRVRLDARRRAPDVPLVVRMSEDPELEGNGTARRRFLDIYMHDIIIKEVYDCIQGKSSEIIDPKFAALNQVLTWIEIESFQNAQWWRSVGYSALPAPSKSDFRKLARNLLDILDKSLFDIFEPTHCLQSKFIRSNKSKDTGYLQGIILQAYEIFMKIRRDILSERLEFTTGTPKNKPVREFERIAYSVGEKMEGSVTISGQTTVLGAIGFGLLGFRESSPVPFVYVQPSVAALVPK